jgi:hypothetical protein
MPSYVVDLLACWKGYFGRLRNVVMWEMVPSCIMWCLWRESNDRCFEDREQTAAELKDFFFETLDHWTIAYDINISSFHVFLDLFSSTS